MPGCPAAWSHIADGLPAGTAASAPVLQGRRPQPRGGMPRVACTPAAPLFRASRLASLRPTAAPNRPLSAHTTLGPHPAGPLLGAARVALLAALHRGLQPHERQLGGGLWGVAHGGALNPELPSYLTPVHASKANMHPRSIVDLFSSSSSSFFFADRVPAAHLRRRGQRAPLGAGAPGTRRRQPHPPAKGACVCVVVCVCVWGGGGACSWHTRAGVRRRQPACLLPAQLASARLAGLA